MHVQAISGRTKMILVVYYFFSYIGNAQYNVTTVSGTQSPSGTILRVESYSANLLKCREENGIWYGVQNSTFFQAIFKKVLVSVAAKVHFVGMRCVLKTLKPKKGSAVDTVAIKPLIDYL